MPSRRFLVPTLALAAALFFAACGVDPTTVDARTDALPADDADTRPADETSAPGDRLVHPDTPAEDVGDDPDANPPAEPVSTPAGDAAGGIELAEGEVVPVEGVVVGRVVGVDRDGPSVEIVESSILNGTDATDAARAAGAIGPDEEWTEEFFIAEGASRWVTIDPAATIAVYDCTQACEHVAGTIEQVLTGAPYGGADALWNFVIEDGRAASVEELYLP